MKQKENKTQILIVDDELNILHLLEKALKIFDYSIQTATTGKSALDLIHLNNFDVIILDLRLPDMDGLEILKQIDQTNSKGKVIMITAHGSIDSAVEAMKLGCVDFIRKPFDVEVLRSTVEQILARDDLSEKQNLEFDSLLQMAKLQTQQKHFRNALQTMQKALKIRPDDAPSYNYVGALYEILGEVRSAINAYQTSLRLDPNYQPAKSNVERIANAGAMDNINLGKL